MSLKYKIILVFSIFVAVTIVPVSLYIRNRLENEQISGIIQQQRVISSIVTQTTLNILMMNGGDVVTSSVDSKEMLSFLKPFFSDGLIYADTILLSSDSNNGMILSSLSNGPVPSFLIPFNGRVDGATLNLLVSRAGSHWDYRDSSGDSYIIFSATGSMPGKAPFCVGRLVFSRAVILAPVYRGQRIFTIGLFLFVVVVMILGYVFTTILSRRIGLLIKGVKMIQAGNLSGKVKFKSRDELGVLAEAFNAMAADLAQKINELESSNRALSRMDRLKDEFLANTSHELRTPVNGIVGIAESLLEGAAGEPSEEMKRNLSMIVVSGRRLGNLVNDILDFSLLKNSNMPLHITSVDLRVTVQLVIFILRNMAERKNLSLRNLVPIDFPPVRADEDRLQQILVNLVGNAIKFTETGEVTVTAVVPSSPDALVAVSVNDTGIGIPPENLEGIFESFEQGEGSRSRAYGGTGLGLAITQKLVELHGGRIEVKSRVGEGSVFTFTLPSYPGGTGDAAARGWIADDPVPNRRNAGIMYTPDPGPVRKHAGANRGRILIVDDEPVNLQVLVNHLGMEGFEVLMAESGHEALNIIEERGAPDLVLLDVMMPHMTGFEVCQIIRRTYSAHELPVIMLTALKRSEDIVGGIDVGANDFISKPFDRRELLARVNNLLALKMAVHEQNELMMLEKEMETARTIQLSILPAGNPRLAGLEICSGYRPMRAVGGDFYDFHVINENRVGILIADVSGHGTPAAIISSMLKVVFALSAHVSGNPALLLERMNAILCEFTHGNFITAQYAVIDREKMTVTCANAGHWPMLIHREGEGLLFDRGKPGRVIGYFQDLRVENRMMPIQAGDRIVFYTDGFLEQRNRDGRMFGEDRFNETVNSFRGKPVASFISGLMDHLTSWSGLASGEAFEDDVTIVVADVLAF